MAAGISNRFIQTQLNIQPDDFVLMNTVALYENYRTYVYWLLETGRLKQAHWFIHEDNPGLRFTNKKEIDRVKKLIHGGSLKVYVPSEQTATDYNHFFMTRSIKPVTLRVSVPAEFTNTRPASDFETLNFIVSGSPWDGRKGQFLLLNALIYFEHHLRKPGIKYRPYTISLLAMGDDYISQQLESIGVAFFGNAFHVFNKMPREKALAITSTCNVTVCSSLNETFALFVAEGMAMGHPILRNKSSGWHEQIKDGENGYLFDDLKLASLAAKIELLLNKETLSDTGLARMGKRSQEIAASFATSDYYNQIIRQ
jgi:glycosyltransferase involved in cell wall biosynthesis